MSVWNRIGQLADNVKDFGLDVAQAAFAAPKFIWDVATAPWNDDQEFNGFTQTMKSAAANVGKNVTPLMEDVIGGIGNVAEAPGVKQTLAGIDYVNREFVREPLASTSLMLARGVGWDEANRMAEDVSFGQALVGAIGKVTPGTQAVDLIDYNDPTAVKNFFSQGAAKFWSGWSDMAIQVGGDLTIVGGKAAKAARASQYITDSYVAGSKLARQQRLAKDINDITEATMGSEATGFVPVVNKWTKVIDDFTANGAVYAYEHPMLRNSPYRSTIASALGQAKDATKVGLLLRASRGDSRALDEIRTNLVDLGNALDRQNGVLDAYMAFALKREDDITGAMFAGDAATSSEKFFDAISRMPHEDQDVVNAALKEIEYLRAKSAEFLEWEKMAETPGGVVTRGTGTGLSQKFDTFRAEARSMRYNTNVRVETWQPSPFHTMYQKVSWLEKERPAGIVNLNEDESTQEIVAFVNRGVKLGGIDEPMGEKLLAGYMRAVTPEERAISISVIENAITSGVFNKFGVSRETAEKFYQNHWKKRTTAIDALHNQGFMIDPETNAVIMAPQFESDTANYLPMIDIDLMHNLLKRRAVHQKSKIAGELLGFGSETLNGLDVLQSMFKAAVLMRLGYTIRNGVEAQMRIAASTGALTSFGFLGDGLRNFVFNTGDSGKRLIDQVVDPAKRVDYKQTKQQLQDLDKSIAELSKEHDLRLAQYEDSVKASQAPAPTVPEFKSSVLTEDELNLLDQGGDLPERFFDTDEYRKAEKQHDVDAAKFAKDYYKRSVLDDPLRKAAVSEASRVFGLNKDEISYFERTGYLPYSKVKAAFEGGDKEGSEFLSGVITAGNYHAVDDMGNTLSNYYYIDPSEIDYRVEIIRPAFRRPRKPKEEPEALQGVPSKKKRKPYAGRKMIRVDWAPEDLESFTKSYVSDSYEMFRDDWAEQKIDSLIRDYLDEQAKHYDKYGHLADWTPPVVDAQALADANAMRMVLDDKRTARQALSDQLGYLEETKRKGAKRFGAGRGKLQHKMSDGTIVYGNAAFNDPNFAGIHMRNASSQESFNRMVDENSALYSRNLTVSGYGAVNPGDENYYTAWARTLNRHFGNSEVARKLLAGETPEQVVRWLRNTPEGGKLARRMNIDPLEEGEYVDRIVGFIGEHFPSQELKDKIAKREIVTPEDLRAATIGREDLPVIKGHVLDENFNLLSKGHFKNMVNSAYRLLGSLPEDAFARHPLYAKFYRDEWKRRLEAWDVAHPGEKLTDHQSALLEDVSHRVALRQMKSTLFTIERKTNFAQLARFIAPFFSAYENSFKTWGRIALENPQTINRLNLLFTAPNRAGIATDAEGNPIPADQATMNDYIWINVPRQLKNLPWIGKGLESLDHMGVQKKSLDVMFQGDAIQLPVGPYVSMPISWVVSKKPDYEQALSWAIPFGPDRNALQALMPAWVKRQMTKNAGMDDQQYANTYALIWQTEQAKRREKGQDPASEKEIRQMVDAYWNMRTVANLVLPFAPTFQSPYKFYIDQFRTYQKQYGLQAKEKFLEDYGDDFFMFSQSLSKNPTGSFASVGSVANAKEHADLVSDLSIIDPSLISLVTNAGVEYSYSNAAYLWQQRNTLSPASAEKFRTKQDPREAEQQNQRDLGWIKYRKAMNEIDTLMMARGLTSLNQKGAADLAQLKKSMILDIGETNTAWYDDYLDTDGSKTNKVIRGLETILSNDKFMNKFGNNPTFKAISVYLNTRNEVETLLATRPTKGINAKANVDLKIIMDSTAAQLKAEDPGFGDLYDRWLSYDPVYDLVHSMGVEQ